MDAPFMSVPLFMVSVIQGAFVNTCRCNNCCSIIDFLSSVVGYSALDGIAQKKNKFTSRANIRHLWFCELPYKVVCRPSNRVAVT